ncbi:MAG TPA: acetyl-CoA C-acyltransferase, partial [Casimicrobiaceae bacterium]|nr:acetyl-CoA C-acyltransferase [Casimicrobiaceae bacterium]
MNEAFICDAVRTPFGRYGGALASVRADDLGSVPLRALMERNPNVNWGAVDDVVYGCANQAGEDNRNVGRMALLLAGLPVEVPGTTVNRLCGSSMDAIGIAARAIKSGETSLMLAGGVESMSRAPFVQGKATEAFSRAAKIEDTTIGWRFINPLMKSRYGVDSMPETAENVAQQFNVSRADQDAFALRSQQRAAAAIAAGRLAEEIVPVSVPQKKGDPVSVATDDHPRATTLETLAKLKGVVRPDGSVTAGNASGVNDGACALILANEQASSRNGLKPRARVIAMAVAGVAPRI